MLALLPVTLITSLSPPPIIFPPTVDEIVSFPNPPLTVWLVPPVNFILSAPFPPLITALPFETVITSSPSSPFNVPPEDEVIVSLPTPPLITFPSPLKITNESSPSAAFIILFAPLILIVSELFPPTNLLLLPSITTLWDTSVWATISKSFEVIVITPVSVFLE